MMSLSKVVGKKGIGESYNIYSAEIKDRKAKYAVKNRVANVAWKIRGQKKIKALWEPKDRGLRPL